MAESVVAPVIDKLVQLLVEEAKLFKGVHRDVQILKDELEIIRCFPKDAEARSEEDHMNEGVKIWLEQVVEEANRIKEVIDEYIRHVAPCRRDQSGFLSFLNKTGRWVKQLKARHSIASQVQDIKMSLRGIKERSEIHGFQSDYSEEGSSQNATYDEQCGPRLDSLFIDEDEVVGIDFMKRELTRSLVEGTSKRTVISLVGEGGIGKTTLARTVYKNEVFEGSFNCCCWITVSQSYNTEKLLKILTEQIYIDAEYTNGETDTIEESINSLRQHLHTQRYLVVFDDVWDNDFWELMKNALPKNEKGSRIIITTRNATVANSCQETPHDLVYQLKSFSMALSWELFCKKAFRPEGFCPKKLENMSRKIVSKCQGLPLVITAIACLLSTKEKIASEWQRVLQGMSSAFERNSKHTSTFKILYLSFNDLPYHLKSCFLYFAIFPKDYSIAETRLYKMWIAEGFVKPKGDKRLEEIAKEYLEELILRNLVQVSNLELHGYDRTCKVHDILQEIILLKADELGLCRILDEKNLSIRRRYRRLSINKGAKNVQEIVEDSGVRSIFVFDVPKLKKSFVVTLFEKCKLLTLLDFENVPLEHLPSELGNCST